jgi:hypothetical protein
MLVGHLPVLKAEMENLNRLSHNIAESAKPERPFRLPRAGFGKRTTG